MVLGSPARRSHSLAGCRMRGIEDVGRALARLTVNVLRRVREGAGDTAGPLLGIAKCPIEIRRSCRGLCHCCSWKCGREGKPHARRKFRSASEFLPCRPVIALASAWGCWQDHKVDILNSSARTRSSFCHRAGSGIFAITKQDSVGYWQGLAFTAGRHRRSS